MLGRELWDNKCGSMLDLVDVWELRKVRLYGDNPQSQSQIAPEELQLVEGVSCVREERQTLVLVCVPQMYVPLLYVRLCTVFTFFWLRPFLWVRGQWP